ncbi:ATP-binding protein [Rhizobium sp. GR12]|uniref:ATP-binding protein n=1 Tax=Rhizobium sp. GR12 TaxID=3053925 RepID=UPI003FA7337E
MNQALVRQLHRCNFLNDANNIFLVGGPDTGKTHLAAAIGAVELVNALEQEKRKCALTRSPTGSSQSFFSSWFERPPKPPLTDRISMSGYLPGTMDTGSTGLAGLRRY